MDLYAITHTHRHGTDVYVVRCNHEPDEDELIKALDIDFEPDREEWLGVSVLGPIIDIY